MEDNNIISFPKKMENNYILTEAFREEALHLLKTVLDVEIKYFLFQHRNNLDDLGRPSVVRNGFLPKRKIHTGIGEILIKVPRVRDRNRSGINFRSKIIPSYLKRTNKFSELFYWYYLQGRLSGNHFEALKLLAGSNTFDLLEPIRGQLKDIWKEELNAWKKRSLSSKKYYEFWIEVVTPPEEFKKTSQNIFVVIGLSEDQKKELLGFQFNSIYGYKPWKTFLIDLNRRGLEISKDSIVGNPSSDFWKAWREIYRGELDEGEEVLKIANN